MGGVASFLLFIISVTASLFCNPTFASGEEGHAANLVRILVADDHDIVCAGLERMIAAQGDMEVCGSAGTGTEAVEKAEILRPDVVILDMNMSGLNGLETT